MKTIYTVGQPDRDSSFISFDRDHEAIEWWRENIEHARETDIRHGSVVKKHTFETEAEAETARLNYMLTTKGMADFWTASMALDYKSDLWLTEARAMIDGKRNTPKRTVVQIWPKPAAP